MAPTIKITDAVSLEPKFKIQVGELPDPMSPDPDGWVDMIGVVNHVIKRFNGRVANDETRAELTAVVAAVNLDLTDRRWPIRLRLMPSEPTIIDVRPYFCPYPWEANPEPEWLGTDPRREKWSGGG